MKNLIIINGTMGVGKTAVSRELSKLLPKNVFLDGDWCWDMRPFTVTEETKAMVMDNIVHLLNNFLKCSEYENIIFCWVLHLKTAVDELVARLELNDCKVRIFTLTASEAALTERILKDVSEGLRTKDVLPRSFDRAAYYSEMDTGKIDVSHITAKEAALIIKEGL